MRLSIRLAQRPTRTRAMGGGVAFMEISPEEREIVQGWIAALESGGARPAPLKFSTDSSHGNPQ
jgi:hypothetical protein